MKEPNFSQSEIEEMRRRVKELKEQRRKLSDEINALNGVIYYYDHRTPAAPEKTRAFQLFGKRDKDLTPEERKQYHRILQAEYRAKKDGKK